MSDTGQPRTWRDPRLPQQTAAFVPMQDPGLRYQYAPPYSPQRTDPDYEKNWQRSPEYSPPQDDTLLGPFMLARAATPQQARQAEQHANVPGDLEAMQEGMKYGVGPVRGQLHLLPQYQQLGNIRPFGPGEFVNRILPDGTTGWSSEETTTTQFSNGRFAVVPTLWMVNGTPMTLDKATATQYAEQSGLIWPMFNTQKAAEDWATQREKRWQQVPDGRSDLQPPLWSRQFPPRQ